MAGISHFMILADDVARARAFYTRLLVWDIEPVHESPGMPGMDALQFHAIRTGPAQPGSLNSNGLYRRHTNEPVLPFAGTNDIDATVVKVEKPGGKAMMPTTAIPGAGLVAMFQDSEGNMSGIRTPGRT
jgi:hypothetical protein